MPDELDLEIDGSDDLLETDPQSDQSDGDEYDQYGQYDPNELVDAETGDPIEAENDAVGAGDVAADDAATTPVARTERTDRQDGRQQVRAAIDSAVEATRPQPQQSYAPSPYATPLMTDEERAEGELLFDERQLAFIQRLQEKAVDRAVSAIDLQYAEARRLGVTDDFMREYGDDIRRFTPNVQPHLRGTQDGAKLAVQMAVADRIMRGANAASEWRKAADLWDGRKAPAPAQKPQRVAPKPVQPIPASAVVGRGAGGAVSAPRGVQNGAQKTGISRDQHRMNKFLESIGATETAMYRK